MKLTMIMRNQNAELFIPNKKSAGKFLAHATHMGIAAHQDDLEIMAFHGIAQCYESKKNKFFGAVVTDGSGGPRGGKFANYSNLKIKKIRDREQKEAAAKGKYAALVLLNYSSSQVRNPKKTDILQDIKDLVATVQPTHIYTHNLADKHETHVAVALRTIEAVRELPRRLKPKAIYGCEVWRDLDWLTDQDKVFLNVSQQEPLARSLLRIFKSQNAGGKSYVSATIGRRRAHATFSKTHSIGSAESIILAMNLTPLILFPKMSIAKFVKDHINRYEKETIACINKLQNAD